MSAVSTGLDPQTITSDATLIVLPTALSPNELIWYEFVDADADDVELVVDAADTDLIRIAASAQTVIKGPFRLRSPDIPKWIRIGTATTIRVTVLRSGTSGK